MLRSPLPLVTTVLLACATGAAACARTEGAEPPHSYENADAALRHAMADPASWPSYGRDYTNQRYSPLTEINAGNVATLRLAWHYRTGIPYSFETSPLVVGRSLYLTTPENHVVKLDAVTGAKRWEYVHRLAATTMCCGTVNRGAAYYDGKIYMGTEDAQLVALDTADGHEIWHVQVGDNTEAYAISHAPVAVDGKVIVGLSGAEYGIRGAVTAYDAATGKLVWRWHTIPAPNEAPNGWWGTWATTDPFGTPVNRDIAQEKRDSARYADAWEHGGGSMWQAPAVDTTLGLLVFGVDNPSPDMDGTVRPGDNLYTDCIVALDYRTGKLQWYLQEVPHDSWDYDPISPVVLADVRDASGTIVPAAIEAGKTGWVYVLDRRTGHPIRRSDAFVMQQNMFTRATREGVRAMPGGNGGSEWSPAAYSPQTGYLYVLGLNEHDIFKLRPQKFSTPASRLNGAWYSVAPDTKDDGTFTAIDLATGKIAWQDTTNDPMVGGALATAGGLVFTGTKDRRFVAFDARTGKPLFQYGASAGVNAPPVSYAVDGHQYIAVAAGGNFQINAPRGDEFLVFALPGVAGNSAAVPTSPGSRNVSVAGRR
ncbi:MAG TPA: PQQ-binding-like beta-propeller repeat protein [Gemmatimonadaceae bacterium]|nr:PQQ-binding-like beta-propeller repeat protein [Gemmatimonadaceae bacterium]